MRMNRNRKAGFSLIEVLFAIFMVLMCALVFSATMPIANTSRAKANRQSMATSLAQKQLESIKVLGYANCTGSLLYSAGLLDSKTTVETDTWAFTNVDVGEYDDVATVLPGGVGTVKIEQLALELKEITIVVQWDEANGKRTVELSTRIANL